MGLHFECKNEVTEVLALCYPIERTIRLMKDRDKCDFNTARVLGDPDPVISLR